MILGPTNLPAEVPAAASQMYSRNIQTFLSHLVKDGNLQFKMDDEITAGTLVAHEGKVTHPRVQQALEGK